MSLGGGFEDLGKRKMLRLERKNDRMVDDKEW